jgi:hypothetical protein
MELDTAVTGIISQLPNFAGLILALSIQQTVINRLQKRIESLEKQVENGIGIIINLSGKNPDIANRLSSGLD